MSICTCPVPTLSCGLREVADPDGPGMIAAYAMVCTTCKSAAQSTHGFEHALMLLRNGPCKPPVIEAP